MCVHVNTLPEDCLLVIFDRVPLLDLLHLDQVCHLWAKLLSSACARRRTVVLIIGGQRLDTIWFGIPFNDHFQMSFNGYCPFYDLAVSEHDASLKLSLFMPNNVYLPNISFYKFIDERDFEDDGEDDGEDDDRDDDQSKGFLDILYRTTLDGSSETDLTEMARLRRANLSGQLVTYLTDLLPNVNNLVVIHASCYEDELYSVIDLIGSSWSLGTLKLWIETRKIDARYNNLHEHHPVLTLLQSINQQPSLHQLTLNIEGDGPFTDGHSFGFPVQSYPSISQLKVVKIFLGNYDKDNSILDIVHRLDSTELRQIGLGNYCQPENNFLNVALDPKYEFSTKVRPLYGDLLFESVEQLGEFSLRFGSLTMLRINWFPNITFTELVANVALLSQLTHLELYIDFMHHPERAFALADQIGEDGEEARTISLPQVKILVIYITGKRSHLDMESLSSFVFPSVEVIILEDYSSECSKCVPDCLQRKNQCLRLLVRSLKNIFSGSSVRLYASADNSFVDYTNHVFTDGLPEIGRAN